MEQFRIMDAQNLHNERQRAKNRKYNLNAIPGDRININNGCVNIKILASAVYPNQIPSSQASRGTSLIAGRIKMLSPEKIKIICDMLGVDPNFIHGFKSIHDDDFERLVKN